MRRLTLFAVCMLISSLVFANGEPVPGDTLLAKLPAGSRVVVAKDILMRYRRSDEMTYSGREDAYSYVPWGAFEYVSEPLYGKRGVVLNSDGQTITSGSVWKTYSAISTSLGNRGLRQLWVALYVPGAGSGHGADICFSTIDGALPVTVADFDRLVGSYFRIIYDDPDYDPYQGMDKGIVVDMLMAKITAALKKNSYAEALPQFILLEKREAALPESFYYYYIDTLEKTGDKDKARIQANDYLKRYGKKGKYYAQVIEIMSRL